MPQDVSGAITDSWCVRHCLCLPQHLQIAGFAGRGKKSELDPQHLHCPEILFKLLVSGQGVPASPSACGCHIYSLGVGEQQKELLKGRT